MKKVVLAYSGGLDTSIIIPWLKENYDCEVICMAADLGQGEELEPLHEKAIKSGASKLYIEDLKEEYVKDYVFPALKAGCIYEHKYLLGTSTARPLIAKRLVEIAEKEGADYIAHGATGKGNDQVRFELGIKALNPDIKIIAPWREWDIKSREDAVDYAEKRGIPVPVTKKRPYSMDRNVFHLSHEGADLENPWNEPMADLYMVSKNPMDAPDEAEYVEIEFEQGVPVAINGEKLSALALLEKANELAAKHGVGIIDMVENRLVGMKSRGVYETPGGTLLHNAHLELESLTLDRDTLQYKQVVSIKYSQLVYDGLWFTTLRQSLAAFVDETQNNVTGTVRIKLYKGHCLSAGVKSPYSLYNEDLATFGEEEVYNQKDAEGFINLFGLPLKVNAMMKKNQNK
ncbi:argininosuccinate synthase [Desulfonispora thiosulfatigenes DSM 11270]|uniref:Argininosuccinate synthase n=1 Tax=Desulfonispora thiosulfatigenes DSM 11270 TaxID=656914 RepID=A0A1W1VCP4_DESTI|nr:argininosuccinate synthase [Desulfonispora thiosulfatigenes]SMB91138.1 argininosuccinate synthase [Desulfonispora thiosulfatigenes DSM 11270]